MSKVNNYKTIALVVAGGSGNRLSTELPKQYMKIADKTILERCCEKLLEHKNIDAVMVVIAKDHQDLYIEATKNLKLLPFTIGGKERQDSVRNGLIALEKYQPETILIHDAARIFFNDKLIDQLLETLKNYAVVIPVSPVTDTIKQVNNHLIERTVDRTNLYGAQTPQVFRYKEILKLHLKYKGQPLTDDANLFEKENIPVAIVKSDQSNFKITTQSDFAFASWLLLK